MTVQIAPLNKRVKWVLKRFFPEADLNTVCATFGKKIYISSPMSRDLEVHEMTHIRQQKNSYFWAVIWWVRYINSDKFRYSQELEAYRNQLRSIYSAQKNKSERFYMKKKVAEVMSSPMYKNMVSYNKAFNDLSTI